MKKIVLLAMLLFNLQIYGQQPKDVGFTQKVFSSAFSTDDRSIWPAVNNEFYFFLIKDNNYIVECTNSDKKAYLLPKLCPKVDSFKVEIKILPDKKKEDEGMAGIAFDILDKLSGGYLFEINSKKQFRVVSVDGSGSYNPISNNAKGSGWVAYKSTKGAEFITMTVKQIGKKVSASIDGTEVLTFDNKIVIPGQTGIFISGAYKTKVQNFTLYKPDGSSSGDAPYGNTKQNNSQDITTLNSALLNCRKENKDLKDQLENCSQEMASIRKKNQDLQSYISQNLDIKLQDEAKKQKEKADKLEAENNKLKSEMEELRALKKTIEENKDGDLVMTLQDNLQKEQKKNAELEKRIHDLNAKKKGGK